MTSEPLKPSAVLPPKAAARRPSAWVTPDGAVIELPAPSVASVGEIHGLAPRGTPGIPAGLQVAAEAVRVVDALPRVPVWVTVAAWLSDAQEVSTRQAYLMDLAAFVQWLGVHAGGMGLLAVREDTVVGYRNSLQEGSARAGVRTPGKPLAPASVARRLATLKKFYAYAMRRAGLRANPADPELVARPRRARVGKTPAFSREQAAAMAAAAGSAEFIGRYGLAESVSVRLLLTFGVRAGELCGLRPSSFGVSGGQPRMKLARKHGAYSSIVVPAPLREPLERLMDGKQRHEHLFTYTNRAGEVVPWNSKRVATALRRAARSAGLKLDKAHAHMARTTVATTLRKEGVPREEVQDLLGHASPETTQMYERGEGSAAGGNSAAHMGRLLGQAPPA